LKQTAIATWTGETLMRNFLNKSSALLLPERIKQLSKDNPFKIAIRNEFGDEISYSRFYKAATTVAEGLRRTGDGRKSVAVMCKDPLQMAIGLFGVWYNNSTAIPLRNHCSFI
jgi:acyl-CoA synthetase (AMP-forming)/AMP-acid ligase II